MSISTDRPDHIDFDSRLLSPEFFDDPYPVVDELRAFAPVYHSSSLNAWIVSPYGMVDRILRDYEAYSNSTMMSSILSVAPPEVQRRAGPLAELLNGNMIMMQDPPKHHRLRRVAMRAFSPRGIDKYRESVTATVRDILNVAEQRGTMDVVEDLAAKLPRITLTDFLGVDREWAPQFADWAEEFVSLVVNPSLDLATTERCIAAYDAMEDYISKEIRRRQATSRDPEDVIDILTAALNAGEFTWNEVVVTCVQLIFAGGDTTQSLIANSIKLLLDNPDQRAILCEQPDLAAAAVEEALRCEGPIRFDIRATTRGTTVGDGEIPADQTVMVSLAGANRDPEVFADPGTFDIRRPEKNHLAFVVGPHTCLGARLARLQGQIVLTEVFNRFPSLMKQEQEDRWHPSFLERRLAKLKVSW